MAEYLRSTGRVEKHMLEIRAVLGDDPKDPTFIETVPRRGYRFIQDVTEAAPEAPEGQIVGKSLAISQNKP